MFNWYGAATLCEELYGVFADYDEEYFICPNCGEPIYKSDWWRRENWANCPICELSWEDGE